MAAFIGQIVYETFRIFKTIKISHDFLILCFSRSVRVQHNKALQGLLFISVYLHKTAWNELRSLQEGKPLYSVFD